MKIVDIKTTLVRDPNAFVLQDATVLPRKTPARGRSQAFVHILTDEGIEGLAPCIGLEAACGVIENPLKGRLLGEDPLNTEKLWNDMFWSVRMFGRKGLAFQAISAIDIALWDLKAKSFGVPLYKLLGPCRNSVPLYGSAGWTNLPVEEMVGELKGYADRGFRAVKMKVARDFGSNEAEDIRCVKAAREALGDDVGLYVDANGGYTVKQAIRMASVLKDYGVQWLEEPVIADDIDGLAQVTRAVEMDIATGENEYTKYGFRDLLTRAAADVLQPDVGRVGGITEFLKVAGMTQAFNKDLSTHAVQIVHLHLGCAVPNLLNVEYINILEAADRLWYTDFPEPVDGTWSPYPDRAGLGVELDMDAIEKHRV